MTEKNSPHIPKRAPVILEMEPGEYWWCACGRSKNQPFCDGSHTDTGFEPVKFEVKEKKRVVWCCCKHTKKQPICDGSHSRIPIP